MRLPADHAFDILLAAGETGQLDSMCNAARRRLAGYMVHPPIAIERLRYRPESAQVIYYGRNRTRSGDGEPSPARILPALDFLAALCSTRR